MVDEDIGIVALHDNANLVFSVRYWKGKPYAHVRKFIHSKKHEGPTKSGLSLDEDELIDMLDALQRLRQETPKVDDYEFSKIAKYKGTDIIISIIKPDGPLSLPSVDIREFVKTFKYTGPTKKGIRFLLDKLPEVIEFFQIQSQRIEKDDEQQRRLFPKPKAKSKAQTPTTGVSKDIQYNGLLTKICPNGFRNFPRDFIKTPGHGKQINLPSESIEITTQVNGACVVRSELGFCCIVRNPIEGKFLLYCWLRGHRSVYIPEKMIEIFKAVKEYENYLRDIRHALILEFQRGTGSRPTAEYLTKEVFKSHGLPWIEHS